jgi:hypothetical protein
VGDFLVRDLMVPLSEYATVPEGSTLFDAVLALEKAQEKYNRTEYRHRGVLILSKDMRVIGKLGQLDVLRGFEPKEADPGEVDALGQYGFSPNFVSKVRKQRRLQTTPLKDLCGSTTKLKVEDFMQTLSEGEFIEHDASLQSAVLQLVMGRHMSLLVTRGQDLIGILRLTDVFAAVFHTMKECEIRS